MNPVFQPYLTALFAAVMSAVFALLFWRANRKAAERQAEIAKQQVDLKEEQAKTAKLAAERFERQVSEIEKLRDSQAEITKTVIELATKDSVRAPYFEELQRSLALSGHHPTKPRKDALLVKMTAWTISALELEELMRILQGEVDDPEVPIALALKIVSPVEKLLIERGVNEARLLLAVVPLALAERKQRDLHTEEAEKKTIDGLVGG